MKRVLKVIISFLIIFGIGAVIFSFLIIFGIGAVIFNKAKANEELKELIFGNRGFPKLIPFTKSIPKALDEDHVRCLYMYVRNVVPNDEHCEYHQWRWKKMDLDFCKEACNECEY
jgi:hypothetical protein